VVVITGGSSGIGRATALACARRGDRLVLAARSAVSLQAAAADCRAAGSKVEVEVEVVPTDVAAQAEVDALLATAVERFGRVDAVVHSVTVVAYGRFEEVPAAAFDRVVATTLIGAANVSRAALRLFRDQGGGSLVIVGSLLGKIVTPYMSSYVTSKWGVQGLARTLEVEARSTPGIQVSLVSPGSVDTPVYRQAASYLGRDGRPPPPVVPPEKVARAVVRCLDRPRRDVNVGVANPIAILGFRMLPALFDVLVTPLMRLGGLSRQPSEPNDGNVFAPHPDGDAVHGEWGRRWLRPASAGLALLAVAGTRLARHRTTR